MPPQLNLPLSKPTFNWDATNLHEAFKGFKQQCDNLLGGPYSDHTGEAKVSAILNWLGIKSYSILEPRVRWRIAKFDFWGVYQKVLFTWKLRDEGCKEKLEHQSEWYVPIAVNVYCDIAANKP